MTASDTSQELAALQDSSPAKSRGTAAVDALSGSTLPNQGAATVSSVTASDTSQDLAALQDSSPAKSRGTAAVDALSGSTSQVLAKQAADPFAKAATAKKIDVLRFLPNSIGGSARPAAVAQEPEARAFVWPAGTVQTDGLLHSRGGLGRGNGGGSSGAGRGGLMELLAARRPG